LFSFHNLNNSSNKKGQVALFIAIGVVILLLAVVFVSQSGVVNQATPTYEVTEKIDEQFSAVRNYVQDCLDKTANTGLDLIGQQGGYIDPKASGIVAGYPGKQQTSGFPFTAGSGTIIPYWYYLAAPMDCSGNCVLDSKAPPLDGTDPNSIQTQLQNYVSAQLDSCLGNFESLHADGFNVTPSAQMQPTVLIRDNDVRFYLNYPLDATRGASTQKITQFVVDEQVPLRPLYNYASVLTTAQAQYNYLEHSLLSTISFSSGPTTALLPPTTATTYNYVSTVFWLKSRVKQQIQDLIGRYVQGLRVANSKNFESVQYNNPSVSDSTNKAVQSFYDNLILPINNSNTNDPLNKRFNVAYEYLDWPIYFDVNSNGEIIRPNSLSVSDFQFGFQQYDTYYDISYPIRVELHDDAARKNAGYTFAFGLQGNIRGNSPVDKNYTLNTIGLAASTNTFVCDADQYNSGMSSVIVVDNITNAPVSDVALSFTCGQETCNVGTTDANGQWSGKLPVCGGASIVFAKDDSYAQRSLVVSTNLNEKLELGNIAIEPYRNVTAAVVKKLIKKQANGKWTYDASSVSLDPAEFAVVSYNQVDPAPGTDPIQGSFIYYGSSGPNNDTIIKLVPGTYEVNVQSILNKPLIIPESSRSVRVVFKKIHYTIPEVDFDQFPSGSLELNGSHGYWTVSAADLDSGNNAVTFSVLAPDIPGIAQQNRVVEDLQILTATDTYMTQNYQTLLPKFGLMSSLPQSLGAAPAPIISLQTLSPIGPVSPGSTVQLAVSPLNDVVIKSYSITSPTVSPSRAYTDSTISVQIPTNANGPTKITISFTLDDGSVITSSTTVQVASSVAITGLSVFVNGVTQSTSTLNQLSKAATTNDVPVKIVASYADGTTRDVTADGSLSLGTDVGSDGVTDPSTVFTLGANNYLHVVGVGSANITAAIGDQSVEIPITIVK